MYYYNTYLRKKNEAELSKKKTIFARWVVLVYDKEKVGTSMSFSALTGCTTFDEALPFVLKLFTL